ncbi:MAG: YdcF family protein [Desulfobacteraceae bacterium]|nr:YdcF family protein [Desulfobacteraceae bacterium]
MKPEEITRKLKLILVICLCIFLTPVVCLVIDGHWDNYEKSDIGVVLGNKVNSDGTLSPRLKGRLDKALELYKNQVFDKIIVSGGIGIEGADEAAAMKKYLITKGVPEKSVIRDSKGVNTYSTAKYVRNYMQNNHCKDVVIISQYHHISRIRLAFHRFGIKKVTSAHADYYEWRDPLTILRELAAYCYYLIRNYEK